MFDAVRNGESCYTEQELTAWVPVPPSGPEWVARLGGQDVLIGEQGGESVGFMTLAAGGYIDLAFIRPRCRRTGLFRQLLFRIAEHAASRGEAKLWTHASLMAEPAFKTYGFVVSKRERVKVGDQCLGRSEMYMLIASDCDVARQNRRRAWPTLRL